MSSPSGSTFVFNDTSVSDCNDEGDLIPDCESGDEFTYSPVSESTDGRGFTGYSLPEDQYSSEHTLQKETVYSQVTSPTSRATFGGANISTRAENDLGNMSALEELLSEVGYLGEIIVRK
jgi:hypothetical protein